MFKNPEIPTDSGFTIWFNKKEKKEFYVTPLMDCNLTFNKKINNTYKEILLEHTSYKFPNTKCSLVKRDYFHPLEEKYGMFLIRFLNADFSNSLTAYNTFFGFYGIELLKEYVNSISKAKVCKVPSEFFTYFTEIFEQSKDRIIELQKQIRECINFVYNLDNSDSYKDELSHIKFLSYALRNDLYNYTRQTNIYFNTLFVNGTDGLSPNLANPSKIRKSIKDGKLNYKTSHIYHSSYLSNMIFVSLNEIAMNTYVTIKKCQNCGKYFIPTSKESEIYCDIVYYKDEKSCRVIGAAETFKKSIGDIEAYKLYKKTYQRILMKIQRGKINPYSEIAKYFAQLKQCSLQILKKYKKGKTTESELNEWMKKSIDKFDTYDEKDI